MVSYKPRASSNYYTGLIMSPTEKETEPKDKETSLRSFMHMCLKPTHP